MWSEYKTEDVIKIPRLYSLFTRYRENGYSFGGETHDFWECLCVLKGEISVTAGERLYVLSEGDMVFHKPLEMHKYEVLSDGAEILVFSFDLEGILCDFFKEKVFRLDYNHGEIIKKITQNMELARKKGIENNLKGHTIEHLISMPEIFQLTVEYIKILLLQLHYKSHTVSLINNKDTKLFKALVEYMKNNITENISVKTLAEEFFVSESTVKRIFKNNIGMGPHSYFFKLKIIEAVEYLKEGLSVGDIASKLGFCDSAYFSTAFKREMGQTPTEYISGNKNAADRRN